MTLRVSSIKTRIKTSWDALSRATHALWEYLPLKQGLRHLTMTNLRIEWDALRVSSIKTRIKTYNVLRNFLRTLRVSSIKTRIKTRNNYNFINNKTSLRVSSIKTRIKTLWVVLYLQWLPPLRVSSIKTRIKTWDALSSAIPAMLWEYLPLKQGLRQL